MEHEVRRKAEKPVVDTAAASTLADIIYGLKVTPGTIKELDSYDDRNFYFLAKGAATTCEFDCNDSLDDTSSRH